METNTRAALSLSTIPVDIYNLSLIFLMVWLLSLGSNTHTRSEALMTARKTSSGKSAYISMQFDGRSHYEAIARLSKNK